MDQVQESGASIHRRRRRRRAAITLSLVALLLLGIFVYAAIYYQGSAGTKKPRTSASPTCQVAVTPVKALLPRAVKVNVYNATYRTGLAASVAKSLRTQGFKVVKVANDPLGRSVKGVGEVRHGNAGTAGAALVTTRLAGAKVLLDDRTDATVDLVLGDKFSALSAPPKVVPAKAAKPRPTPSRSC